MSRETASSRRLQRPNFLIYLVDEERYPPAYEGAELRGWRERNLVTQELLRAGGTEFHRHYIGAAACCPSRATLLTGHYPSLHGVSQTDGATKSAFDSDMYWLDPNTVPTMGHYFQAAGYRTFYKGKWHISDADILTPGTHRAVPSYDALTGIPDPDKASLYLQADRLKPYGFESWIGPEPHGRNPHNSASSSGLGASGRDEAYADQLVALIRALNRERETPTASRQTRPWLMVASFVNPHDIVLYGALTARLPMFRFEVDETVPPVPPSPTDREPLHTKPRRQASYRAIYPQAMQPIGDEAYYRRLYYQLQKNADRQMLKVFEALRQSSFYENTIVLFTSDHGELLGSHGGLHQKWYCAYEEVVHVPLIFHNPVLYKEPRRVEMLTSHLDLLPTLLGLAGIDANAVQERLRAGFSEVRPFVGRDLSPLLLGRGSPERAGEPVYFMVQDDIFRGQHPYGPLGNPYPSVQRPNHIETVIAVLQQDGTEQLWKLSRYYEDPAFGIVDGERDIPRPAAYFQGSPLTYDPAVTSSGKDFPVQEEYEMYNLTEDPLEARNLMYSPWATPQTMAAARLLYGLLQEQRRRKRLTPAGGTPPSSTRTPGGPS
ncbi:sulfatase-like hydrolase/transferase [Paenibacillus sp. P25]|nr:sulfatase-like hydrolase/transferase [Paenibacillus sp. P25]